MKNVQKQILFSLVFFDVAAAGVPIYVVVGVGAGVGVFCVLGFSSFVSFHKLRLYLICYFFCFHFVSGFDMFSDIIRSFF